MKLKILKSENYFIPFSTPTNNIQALTQKYPGKPVVVYSSMDLKIWRRKMWGLGASGYVHKNDGRDVLKQAVIKRLREKFNTQTTPQMIHLLTEKGLL